MSECLTTPDWRRFRAEFPVTGSRAYLFAGGMAPLSLPGRAALDAYAQVWTDNPERAYRELPSADAVRLREGIAALIGAEGSEVAIVDSTSRGNALAAAMVEAPPGSNVVVDSTTYPTARAPWLVRPGVELRVADDGDPLPSSERIAAAVDEMTVAVSISHVCRLSGYRHDLRELSSVAHAVGAVLLVDAAQSAGVVPIDVRSDGVDFLAFGAMKWLLGAPGVAFFWVRPALQQATVPPNLPASARLEEGRLVLPEGGVRHELSSLGWPALGVCRAGLELLRGVPSAIVEARVLELGGSLIDGLLERGFEVRTPADPRRRGGVVAFTVDRADELAAVLRDRGVDTWASGARRLVRADPHVYNDENDLARFFAALETDL